MKYIHAILLVLLFLCSVQTNAQTRAIILIRPEAVSRVISPDQYNHGLWIRWPLPSNSAGSNRLLSPITGEDWSAPLDDLRFLVQDHTASIQNLRDLRQRGVLRARKQWLGFTKTYVLSNSMPSHDPQVALLGINDEGKVPILHFNSAIPPNALLLYSAQSWDDAAGAAKLANNEAIIVAYPPQDSDNVSAAWFLARPKDVPVPTSTGVPGLLPAKEIIRLLDAPKSYGWLPAGEITAEQWMSTVDSTRVGQILSMLAFVIIVCGFSLWAIAKESGGKLSRLAIALALSSFASLFIAGNIAKLTGLMPWNILPFFAYFGLILGLGPVYLGVRALWPQSHPLFPIAFMTSIFLLWVDPVHTVFSNVLTSTPTPVSALALGGLVASLTGAVAFSLQGGIWPRILAGATVCVAMVLGVFTHQWWAGQPFLLVVPVLALVAGVGLMRVYWLPLLIVWPLISTPWNGLLAWDPGGLIYRYTDLGAINVADQMRFLLSPAWLLTLVSSVGIASFGSKFLRHQLRRCFLCTNPTRALLWAALGTACFGVREGYLLPASLVVGIVALLTLLFDSTGAL